MINDMIAVATILTTMCLGLLKILWISLFIKDDPDEKSNLVVRSWALNSLERLGVQLDVQNLELKPKEPCILFGNHLSYVDILVLLAIDRVSFVAKRQVRYWPIIGFAAKSMDVVFVRRSSQKSRSKTAEAIQNAIHQKKQIVVFPAGTTSIADEPNWRHGIFKISQQFNVLMAPFRINYAPKRPVAYIDDDILVTHVFRMMKQRPIKCVIQFAPSFQCTDVALDCEKWRKWSTSW